MTKQKYKSWAEVPLGTMFKVVRNTNNHNYPLNTPLTVSVRCMATSGAVCTGYNHLNIGDVEFIDTYLEELKETKKLLKDSIAELQSQLVDIQSKIDYCIQNRIEKFDDTEYKVYQIIKEFEKGTTIDYKVKKIAALIKS